MTRTWKSVRLLSLVCLLAVPGLVEANWKMRKNNHGRSVSRLSSSSLDYFANGMKHERLFNETLQKILVPRVPDTPQHREVREFVVARMQSLGWHTELVSHTDTTTPIGRVTFHNIVATLDPKAPRRLVLACHYDSKMEPKGFLGATDSAVPCAMMINLAQAMYYDLQDDLDRGDDLTLQLVFFDGEEAFEHWTARDSIYGSRNLAHVWEQSSFEHERVSGNHLDRMDVLVLLDLIGAPNPTFYSLQQSTQHWFDRLVRIERRLAASGALTNHGRYIFRDDFKRYNSGIEDDHIPFLHRGVPVLHLIATPFPRVWHKMSDNMSALDFNSIANLNKILRVFVAEYLQLTP